MNCDYNEANAALATIEQTTRTCCCFCCSHYPPPQRTERLKPMSAALYPTAAAPMLPPPCPPTPMTTAFNVFVGSVFVFACDFILFPRCLNSGLARPVCLHVDIGINQFDVLYDDQSGTQVFIESGSAANSDFFPQPLFYRGSRW